MQLLFEKSYEYGEHRGLGFVKGEVCPLEPDLKDKTLKVPQIGWNALHLSLIHISAEDFLDELDIKMRSKLVMTLKVLQEQGTRLREPYSKHLDDGIFEIRGKVGTDISRVMYFFYRCV